jgi:hypothetical protein
LARTQRELRDPAAATRPCPSEGSTSRRNDVPAVLHIHQPPAPTGHFRIHLLYLLFGLFLLFNSIVQLDLNRHHSRHDDTVHAVHFPFPNLYDQLL